MFLDQSHLLVHNPPALHYGIAVLDLDGDGVSEFFVTGYGGPNRILKWVDGQLRDLVSRTLADADKLAIGVAAADLDGDGREELYVLNADSYIGPKQQADRLFVRRGHSTWIDLFSDPQHRAVRNLAAGRSVAAIDRRGTGRYGFFIANYGQPIRLYELTQDGAVIDRAGSLGLNLTTGGRGLWTGPLVSDRSDVFCVNERGPNFLFRNRGNGTFEEVAHEYDLQDPEEHARGVTVLDLDADGRLDVCWGNWDGPHRLMVRQVDGTFRDRASPALALPSPIRTVLAADFDNDGFEELFFNNLGEVNRLFGQSRPGDWRLKDPGAASEPFGLGTGAAYADIDNDGILELLIAHGETTGQPLSLYKVPTTGNWLRVQPRTRFGAPARGATVRLTAGGRTQIRILDGGSGYLCQMEPVAHFGLGTIDHVDSVTVTWPDGAKQSLLNVPIRTTIDLPYP